MPLHRPRRIFVRKRRPGWVAALRPVAVLALGALAATFIGMLSEIWPSAAQVSDTQLPSVREMPGLRAHDPTQRVAAAVQDGAGEAETGHGSRSH